MKIKGQIKCQRPVLIIVGCFRIAGKDLHEVSINTRVSDMRILHIDTPARLLERERRKRSGRPLVCADRSGTKFT